LQELRRVQSPLFSYRCWHQLEVDRTKKEGTYSVMYETKEGSKILINSCPQSAFHHTCPSLFETYLLSIAGLVGRILVANLVYFAQSTQSAFSNIHGRCSDYETSHALCDPHVGRHGWLVINNADERKK
jgi:hypothetical protein